MGLAKFVRTKILTPIFGAKAAAVVVDAGMSVAEKLVAAIKASTTGAQLYALVHAANESGKTGPEKMADVLAAGMPLVLQLVTSQRRDIALAEVETITRSTVESILTDIEASKAGSAVATLLGVFGIKL